MGQPFRKQLVFGGHYDPANPPTGPESDRTCLISGRNMWARRGYAESWFGMGTLNQAMNCGLMVPLAQDILPGGIGNGTVLIWRGDVPWFIGSGGVFRNAVTIATASSSLQFLLNSVLFTAGLAPPAAPLAFKRPTSDAGKCTGNFSFKLTQLRTETMEESNASAVSNVISGLKNQKAILSLQGIATAGDGKRWRIYGSDAGFSQLGDWFDRKDFNTSELSNITDDQGQTRTMAIAFDYYDQETNGILAPFNFTVPPSPATHLTTLGSVMIVLGSFGGSGVSPSLPGRLAWPTTFTRFLNPAEPIVRVDGRPGNGWQAIFTRHSVQTLLLSGDENGPVFVRSWLPTTGISNLNGALMLESEIYAISADGYIWRTSPGGLPDSSFADPVRPDIAAMNPDTTKVAYHPKEDAIIYFDVDAGLARPFMRGQVGGRPRWCTPFEIPEGAVQAAAVVGKKLHVQIAGALYTFDTGNGSGVNWRCVSALQDVESAEMLKTVLGWRTHAKGPGTMKLYDGDDESFATALKTSTDSDSGVHHTNRTKLVAKKLFHFAMERSGTGGGRRAYSTTVDGVIDTSMADK